MEYRTIRTDIFDKVTAYDEKHETNLATLLSQKLNNAHDAYTRGVLHGICLTLTYLDVITKFDAVEILEGVHENG